MVGDSQEAQEDLLNEIQGHPPRRAACAWRGKLRTARLWVRLHGPRQIQPILG